MTRPLQGALIGFGFIAEKGHVPAYLSSPDAFDIVDCPVSMSSPVPFRFL